MGTPDRGIGQLLEVMVIGSLVLGAVAFAVAFQAPPPPSATSSSQNLGQKAFDAAQALDRMHYPDESYGNSTLSKAIADAGAGNPDPLAESIQRFLPEGAQLQLFLNNGYDRFPLYTNQTPSGQAVGVSYPLEPRWRFHYGETELRLYNANSSHPTMETILAPIFNSNHVRDEGQYVQARVDGEYPFLPGKGIQSSDDPFRRSFSLDAYSSIVQGDDSVDYPSASIYLECERSPTDQPCYAIDLTEDPIEGYGTQEKITNPGGIVAQRLDLVVDNDGPGNVSAGTTLTVRFPVGLQVVENATNPDGGLEAIEHVDTPPDPQTVTAQIGPTALDRNDQVTLQVWVNRTDTRYAYKRIDATLSGGAVSQSQLLAIVQDKPKGTTTGGDTRKVLISGPKPAGSTDDGTLPSGRWGIVMPAPVAKHTLTNVTFQATEGDGPIAAVDYPEDFDPTWPSASDYTGPPTLTDLEHDDAAVWWEPDPFNAEGHEVPAYTFLELQLNLTLDGEMTEASPEYPFTRPQTKFTGLEPPSHARQIEPGIWSRAIPPSTGGETPTTADDLPGYGAGSGGPTETDRVKERTFDTRLPYRNSVLTGQGTYHLADLDQATQGAIKDVVQTARLTNDPQRVRPGETVDMSLNVEDFATYLSGNTGLNDLDLTTHIYAPWGIPNGTPARTYTHHAAAGSATDTKDLMAAWIDGDDAQDLLVANGDGNVYSLAGDTGNPILERTFTLPGADASSTADPLMLTRSFAPGTGQIYGVGTDTGSDHWYSLDPDVNERWRASKAETGVATRAVNTSVDVTGDGIPEFVAAHPALEANRDTSSSEASRITLWNGLDTDGDGTGDLLDGWGWDFDEDQYGVVVPGESTRLGMGKLGARADPGVFANTGFEVSDNVDTTIDATLDAVVEEDLDGATNITYETFIRESGLVGFHGDGRRVWNYSGGSFVELFADTNLDTGGDWSSIVAADQLGWVYGFNGSQPVPPVMGWTYDTPSTMNDVAMANELEGYIASEDGILLGTRDGWTTMRYHESGVVGSAAPEITYPGVQAVDTPDAPVRGDGGNVSWWAGDGGLLLRSTDRLRTMEELSTTGKLRGVVAMDASTDEVSTELPGLHVDEQTVDLTKIDFNDVLAVNRTEAYFVGEGAAGTSLDDYGYVVHTTDGGETMRVTRLDCEDAGTTIEACGVEAIGTDGETIWIAGESGLVLTRANNGQAGSVDLTGSPGIQGYGTNDAGRLVLNLSSTKPVEIRNVTVGWDPATRLDWTRGVELDNGTLDALWNKTHGEPYIEGPTATTYSDKGAALNATLFVRQYTNNVDASSDADRRLDGTGQLYAGPFRTELLPDALDPDAYFTESWYDDNRPLSFHVEVTYEDGSADIYVVQLRDDGAIAWSERSDVTWRTPGERGYDTPDACFGVPEPDCAPYKGLNFTLAHPDGRAGAIVGEPQANTTSTAPQAALVRLAPGGQTFERAWDLPLNKTYTDVSVSPDRPDEWVAVGGNARVLKSFDAGANWTQLMTPATTGLGSSDGLRGVDYTNPHTAYLVGGNTSAQLWTVDGYREYGRTQTKPLPRTDDSTPGALEKIQINTSKLEIGDTDTGSSAFSIEVWDAGLERWVQLYNSTTGWVNTTQSGSGATLSSYVFAAETSEVELRLTLSTAEGFSRFSPHVEGTLNVSGWTDHDPMFASTPDVELKADLADPGRFEDLGALRHSEQHGFLRLPGARNLWVEKLGNANAGDWSDVGSATTAPRITAADLAPNGTDLYVGTGGIYDVASEIGSSTSIQMSSGGTEAWDASLYRIDVTTGEVHEDWGPLDFSQPIQGIEAGDGSVYVHTLDPADSSNEEVWQIRVGDDQDDDRLQVGHIDSVLELETIDAIHETKGYPDDLAVSFQADGTDYAYIEGYSSHRLLWAWTSTPQVKGNFDFSYDVPRNALYGAHLVVSEFKWTVQDDFGEDVVQTARIHNSFEVTPLPGRTPIAPTYNLEIVVWMEDWG